MADDTFGSNVRQNVILWAADGSVLLGQKTMADAIPVAIASDQTPGVDKSGSGTVSAVSTGVEANTEGCGVVSMQVTGTWVGTLQIQATINDIDWFQIVGFASGSTQLAFSEFTENDQFRVPCAGYKKVRAYASSWTSGTATIYCSASPGSSVTRSSVTQNIVDSLGNSSVANLNAGASFTGLSENGYVGTVVNVNFISDVPTMISIEQSNDGTNWDTAEQYNIRAGEGSARPTNIHNEYFRIIVTNVGASTSTYLRLHTQIHSIGAILPHALTRGGNLRTTIVDDQHDGKETQFSAFGLLKVANESILGDYRFDAASLPGLFDVTTTGTGGYTIEAGGTGAKLSTGASASSKIELQSKIVHAYKSGRGHMVKISIILGDSGVAGNIREWGLSTTTNGTFVRLNGTALEWVILSNSVETVIDSADWDVPVTLDGNGHIWYIQMEWLGVGDLFLYYDERIVHRYRFTGTSTDFSLGSPDLPLWYRNENVANTTDVYLKTGCASVVMEGGTLISGVDANGLTREVRVDADGNMLVAVVIETVPLGATGVVVAADTPLAVDTHDTAYVIPNGVTFHLQQFIIGNEDPTKGARIEIIYYDGTTEHVVMRSYGAGFTVSVPFPNINEARDGTLMAGNGSTKTIIIRRTKLTGTNIEIDATVRGYIL